MVDIHTHLREPGREDAETVETGTRAAALGGTPPCTRWPTAPRWRTPPASSNRYSPSAAPPAGGRPPGRSRHRRPRGGAARRTRREADSRATSGSSPTTGSASTTRADAPGAGIRQGVRRRGRPARAGTPAHRRRPDERGRRLRRPRPGRLAGRRRREHHRPGRAASPARRLPPARLPRLHGRLRGNHPLGQIPRRQRHGRGHPAPPLADGRASPQLRPVYKVNPPLRTDADVRPCAPRWPTARSTSSAPTTPPIRANTRNASGRRRPWA